MSELQITYDGRLFTFAPGTTVRIGRSADNNVVINDPTVSRQHAQLSWGPNGWVWQNAGQAPTFLSGQPVAQFGVSQPVEVYLASPTGPAVRLASAVQAAGPVRTEVAGVGGAPGYAPQGAGGPPQAYAAPGAGGPPQAYAAGPPQGYQGAGAGAPPQGYGPGPGVPGQGFAPAGAVPPGMAGFAGGPGGGIPVSELDMGSFFEILIPIKSWIHERGWHQGIRLLIIPYALLPLIFLGLFSNSGNLTTPGWSYALYIAPLWLLTFWYLIRPPQIGWFEVFIAIGVILWTIGWLHVVTIYINDNYANTHNILGSLVVGYNEESTKAIPVLIAAILVLKVWHRKLDPRTWFLMGTIAGLTFGVVEQSIYTPAAIVGIHSAQVAQQAVGDTLLFAFRVFVDGFQHAVWAGVSGFFVGMAVNYRRRRIPLLLLGVSIPAVLHALNDYTLTIFSTVWVAVLIQGVSLLLFLGYTLSASSIERRVRRNPNFRGQSIMMERFSTPEEAV
jgi:RsiW-degrading membrane proteinase PrsW (M82 family)